MKPFLVLPTRPLTLPSFTTLAVLFPDCQKLTYVKQQNVALPFPRLNIFNYLWNKICICKCIFTFIFILITFIILFIIIPKFLAQGRENGQNNPMQHSLRSLFHKVNAQEVSSCDSLQEYVGVRKVSNVQPSDSVHGVIPPPDTTHWGTSVY